MDLNTFTEEAAKVAPPAVVTGLNIFGVALPDIIQILTLVYLFIVIADKGWSLYKRFKDKENGSEE